MADPNHLEILAEGVDAWNRWRKAHPGTRPDLSFANLHLADLSGVNLRRAELRGVDLSFANLHFADLSGTNLRRANLIEANLRDANLIEVNLIEADLRDANLCCAYLQVARLTGTRLDGAILTDAGLFKTQRAGWFIQDVICEAVYWDMWRKERTVYALGEFEQLFAEKTEIILHYADGIRSIEIAALPALIPDLETDYPGCKLRLQSLAEAPGGATVTLVIDDPGQRLPAEIEAMKAELETTGNQRIEWQRQALRTASKRKQAERLYQMFSSELEGSVTLSA